MKIAVKAKHLREGGNNSLSTRRNLLRTGFAAIQGFSCYLLANPAYSASKLEISNRYSPYNKKRPKRPYTDYIILHTTEGAEAGSLNEVWRYGETHYFVTKKGHVYRIIDKTKIASHAGRSMWEGKRNIDNYAIGIEVSGYHNEDITPAQYTALRELLRQLKSLYGISDRDVLTHSMVAYGSPNRYHAYNHRGRKRCGMIFARPDVRERLGLTSKPVRDPDVASGRLKVADPELQSYLYAGISSVPSEGEPAESSASLTAATGESSIISKGRNAWSIAREHYNSSDTTYIFPGGARLRGDEIRDWAAIPSGTRVMLSNIQDEQGFEGFLEIGKDGDTAQDLAGNAYADRTTIYFFPDGLIRTGYELKSSRTTNSYFDHLPKGTRVLLGYIYGGYVKTSRLPVRIAGAKWNYPSTFYRFPDGRVVSGDEIDPSVIPPRTLIFFRD